MGKYKKLSHSIYYCDYHIVWVPKYRNRLLDIPAIKERVEEGIEQLSQWLNCEVKEKSVQKDHVHIIVSIPPKLSVSKYVGTVKGKLAIKLFQEFKGIKKQKYWGNHFWARGYFVNTVGVDSEMIRKYVKYQEKQEKRAETDQRDFNLF